MIAAVTGATGFIGSHTVDRLIDAGYRVRAMVRASSDIRWLRDKPVELVPCDFRMPDTLDGLVRDADLVFHVAGVVKARSRAGYMAGNVDSTRVVAEATRRSAPAARRFVLVSSQTATGPSPSLENPVDEDSPCRPITRYGESKLAAERALRDEFGDSLRWTVVRLPAVFGPRDTEIFVYFDTVRRGLNSIIGFDDKRLSLLHVRDAARGLVEAAVAERTRGNVYFLSSERPYSWPEVGRVTAAALGRRVVTLHIPHAVVYAVAAVSQGVAALGRRPATLNIEKARDIAQRYWTCSAAKAARDFGYRQEVSLDEGVRDTVEWYRAAGWMR